MEDSQGTSKVFSVRIVSIDYYMATPIPDVDIAYSSFQGGNAKEVPVIRVYGSTPPGQKACVHIHRALPYLYIPCLDIPLQSDLGGSAYENAISLAVEKALKLKGSVGSKRQHVHGCSMVRAKRFYGYHSSEELFVKIYLYYPQDISRLANLLLGGAIFEKIIQPYESHIPFLLQFMVDYNLYGMGHVHLLKMQFRHPVPDDVVSETADHFGPEAADIQPFDSQADAVNSSCSSSLVWSVSTIPDDWMWPYSVEPSAPSNSMTYTVKRQSSCQLEGDAIVDDILNQQCKTYTSLSQLHSDVRMVQSLIPIWEEEIQRSGMHETEMLADPGKPLAQSVIRTFSAGVDYVSKLTELYSKAESTLSATSEEDVGRVVPAHCSTEERSLVGTGTQNSEEQALMSAEALKMSIQSQNSEGSDAVAALRSQVTEGLDSKAADPEDVALLKWLASSQAAEEINSDDELRRDTILNPLLPAASINKVLEKANTDYETETLQECQDILDSLEDVLTPDDQEEKAPSTAHDKVPQALSAKTIPQLDGAGDDHLLTTTANTSDVVVDSKSLSPNRETFPPCNTGLSNEHIRQKLQWGYLPLSLVRKRNEDIHSGTCSVNMSIKSSGQDINDSLIHSSVKCGSNICNDLPSKSADIGGSNSIESRTLLGCSVRDLMRKKRCFRAGLSEHTRSERVNLRRKLEFHAEQSKDDIMPPFEASASGHIQMSEAMELCENILSPPLLSGGTRKQDCTNLPATCNDKELQFGVFASKNLESSLDMTCQNTNNENENFIYGDLRQSIASCSNCCTGKGKMFLEDCRPGEFRRAGTVEQYPSLYMDLESGYGFKEEKGPSGYVRMSFYKKPPVSWKSGTSENLHFKDPSLESISESDDEEITDKSEGLENVLPFFTESNEGLPIKSYSSNDFYRESCLGVPTYYQNDGSFAYLLTPAISPPSVYSVLEWLGVKERANLLQRSIPEPTLGFGLQPRENQVDQESHKNVKIGGGLVSYELQRHQEQSYPMKAKEDSMASQDISQISGPTRHSKPTPLSQIGFRDPASVGAGQQLTIISIEVQAESRGDLRPDPQHDAINIIVLSIQNDNCTSVDTHVLLRGAMETCGRNFDGITTGKLFVCSEEIGLLDLFVNKVRSIDPDILMGWDIQGSSLGFLAERAAHLGVSLLNKISRTPSETKTEKKEPVPAGKGNSDADSCDSIISDTVIHDNAIIEDEWGRTHASGVHVGGRIVLNVWRLVRGEVKLNMYTLEAVAEAVLRRKVPSIPWKILNEWFLSGPQRARFRCIDYLVERAKLNLDILDQLDMVNRTSELARIFGIDFFSVLSRGSQYRVESMLVRLAHTQNYVLISPGYQQVASQPAMECLPLVMEPESGFYPDPVIVLDFQSLYPSMIIAYNLCFCTCLGNVAPSKADTLGVSSYSPNMHILKDLHQQILVTPNGVMYVPSKARKGVLPRLLEEILSTRIMVKKAMKKLEPSQKILHRIFNARQLALKLIANVTYGYTAAGFSGRMPCAELADSIVQCGRRTLEQAISVVNAHDQWNARVVYGDTDSMFVLVKGRTVKEAFQIGKEIASTITALNPNPVTLKMEKVYQSCFLLTKKRYVGYSYESPDQPKPTFDAKGIETVRRDTCGAVAKILEKSLRLFFKHQDISKVRVYLERQWSRILSKRVSLQDFVFAKEVRLGTYSMRASSSLPPAAIVASKAMRADPRAEPRYAERVPYVVVHGEPGARLIDMVVDPHELLAIDSPYRLNDVYYITKQIIPALQRVFGLVGADLSQWFQEMPRPSRDAPTKHHFNAVNSVRARIDHYYSSRHCVLCRELTQGPNHLCEKCSKKGPVAAAAMTGITSRLERDIQHLVTICRHCGGGDWLIESGVKCTSLACPMYYERRKVQKELRAFSSIATDASFYPKCVVEWF